jgi:hypothetical protein
MKLNYTLRGKYKTLSPDLTNLERQHPDEVIYKIEVHHFSLVRLENVFFFDR